MNRHASSRIRKFAFLSSFCVALCSLPLCAYRAMEADEAEQFEIPLDMVPVIENSLDAIRDTREALWSVVYFGDSTVIGFPPEHHLPKRLQESINQFGGRRPPIRVLPLAVMGLTPFDIYFLSERVIEAGADQVIIPFNLAAFSPSWRTRFPRPELAGWMKWSAIPRALILPLYHIGLTVDRLLMNQLFVRIVGFDTWQIIRREQTRVGRARQNLELWASQWQHPNSVSAFRRGYYFRSAARFGHPKRKRYNEVGMRNHHGDAFEGQNARHPVFRILAESLRLFDEAGIPALVYLVPINWEYARSLGVYDEKGLAQTIDSLVEITDRHHASLLDLHKIFPDAGFVDEPGHFTHEGEYDGPRVVADQLAPPIVKTARRARRAKRKAN